MKEKKKAIPLSFCSFCLMARLVWNWNAKGSRWTRSRNDLIGCYFAVASNTPLFRFGECHFELVSSLFLAHAGCLPEFAIQGELQAPISTPLLREQPRRRTLRRKAHLSLFFFFFAATNNGEVQMASCITGVLSASIKHTMGQWGRMVDIRSLFLHLARTFELWRTLNRFQYPSRA